MNLTKRELGMLWWNMLSPDERSIMVKKYSKYILMGDQRVSYSTLTGREIEIIYKGEVS